MEITWPLVCRYKGVEERIDKGVLQWFGNVERMENTQVSVLVVAQWVGRGRDGLIP